MKKAFKIVLKSFLCLLGAILVFAVAVIINGTCMVKYKGKNPLLKNWQSLVSDNVLVSELVMPGSHDAGTKDIVWLGETQNYTVKEQMLSGARYFDLRVNKKENGDLVIYHDILNGLKFIPILNDIKEFLIANPTEVLLLDFQHFKGGSQTAVKALIEEYLYNNNLLVVNQSNNSNLQFISQLTLGQARGKAIVFWGDRSAVLPNYMFMRNNDECTHADLCLNSYYLGDIHKGKIKNFISDAFPIYYKNITDKIANEGYKGIFVLQSQLTDGKIIFGPYSREKLINKRISEYVVSLKDSPNLQYVNVIMRDFLTEEKCLNIIQLNHYKHGMPSLIS